MKVKLLTTYLLFLLFIVINPTYAQTWCLDLPSTVEDIEACNRGIARTFAPILKQFSQANHPHSISGNADRILKVNYDINSGGTNNWVATDNWDNLVNVGNPSFGQYDVRPHTYYAVTWSDQVWIIVYSFYYARDWAVEGNNCDEDEHEGDMAKVFVVVKRPDSENQSPEEMLLGYKTTVANNSTTCPTKNGVLIVEPSPIFSKTALGAHPIIFSAAGSHHYYLSSNDAQHDVHHTVWNDQCVVHGNELMIYTPPANDSYVTTTLTPFSVFPFPTAYYGLIDIFDIDEGLWEQRTTPTLFNQDEPLNEQHFLCDSGEGCLNEDGTTDHLSPDGTPWAPWTGSWGVNPLQEIFNNGFNGFHCNCSNSLEGCQGFTITECIYEYNPYLCEFYDIEMPGKFQYNSNWVNNPLETGGDLKIHLRFAALGVPANAKITWGWSLPPGFNNDVSCDGCSQKKNAVTFTIEDASLQDLLIDPELFVVTATMDGLVECGEISKEFSLKVQLKNIVSTDTVNCEKMVLAVKETWHTEGNVYDWSFPLYNALAAISTNGRRVEFDTETVLQQTSQTTNPDSVLAYRLKVTNPAYADSIEIDSSMKIPDCQYDSELSLVVYPNPASDNIFVKIRGMEEPATNLEFVIFDHQFNQISKHPYSTEGQNTVSVARLQGGIYYLYAITGKGKILCEKFCVIGH